MFESFRAFCVIALMAAMISLAAAPARAGQSSSAASQATSHATTVQPAANSADVSSPDAILAALYQVISGPAGQKRRWNRFRSLFLPGARLIPTSSKPTGGERAQTLTPEDYVAHAAPYFDKNGFFEKEVARKAERFGGIMQVFSTYESRHTAGEARPFARGINSIQLFFDGSRWWIVTVLWEEESPSNPLPAKFLPRAPK
jgi:hypothetical protein